MTTLALLLSFHFLNFFYLEIIPILLVFCTVLFCRPSGVHPQVVIMLLNMWLEVGVTMLLAVVHIAFVGM